MPLPPFTRETALQKVQLAEDAWNTRDPDKVAMAFTIDCQWRARDRFLRGREAIKSFLKAKWEREWDYHLRKKLFCFEDDRIAVHFRYEYRNVDGQWFRAYGNEHWTFAPNGQMSRRDVSTNEIPIREEDRMFRDNDGVDSAWE
jgi:uncharacterized protein (TIGR02246 family)